MAVPGTAEPCVLGNEIIELPKNLLTHDDAFNDVFNIDTWHRVLNKQQQDYLRNFLPSCDGDTNKQDECVQQLFSGENINFGNPLKKFQKSLRKGDLQPDEWYYRQLREKLRRKAYKQEMLNYHTKMLEDLVVLRDRYMSEAVNMTEEEIDEKLNKNWPKISRELLQTRVPAVNRKAEKLYKKVMVDMRLEFGDDSSSSDTCDMAESDDEHKMTDDNLSTLLQNHRKRRLNKEIAPTLDTRGITVNDIIARVYKPDHVEEEDTQANTSGSQPFKKQKLKEKKKKTVKVKTEVPSQSEEKLPPYESLLFLLRVIMKSQSGPEVSTTKIIVKLNEWLQSREANHCSWVQYVPDWTQHLPDVLAFLAGEVIPKCEGIPLVTHTPSGAWMWTIGHQDTPERMHMDWQYLLESMPCLALGMAGNDPGEPKPKTDYVVQPSTPAQRSEFQRQESERFENPHKGYVYKVNGYEAVVGPVKGVYEKHHGVHSNNKAREHVILVNERPSYVTILTLVRDAAARMPNGEGTRADICELLKDSQFISEGASDQQINTVVSGALDRLHYEKDPCVKYESTRKVWIYLHRSRSATEFERIHEAQGAALKAKKALKPTKAMAAAAAAAASQKLKAESAAATASISSMPLPTLGSDTSLGGDDSLTAKEIQEFSKALNDSTPLLPDIPLPPLENERTTPGGFVPVALPAGKQVSITGQKALKILKNASMELAPPVNNKAKSPVGQPVASTPTATPASPVQLSRPSSVTKSFASIVKTEPTVTQQASTPASKTFTSIVKPEPTSASSQQTVKFSVTQPQIPSAVRESNIDSINFNSRLTNAAEARTGISQIKEEVKVVKQKTDTPSNVLGYPSGTVFYQRITTPQGRNAVQKVVTAPTTSAKSLPSSGTLVHRIVGGASGSPVLARLIHTQQSQSGAGNKGQTQPFSSLQLQGSKSAAQGSSQIPANRPVQILTTSGTQAHLLAQSQAQGRALKHQAVRTQSPMTVRGQGGQTMRVSSLQQHLGQGKLLTGASSILSAAGSSSAEAAEHQSAGKPNIQLVKALISSEGKQGGQAYILTTSASTHGTSLIASQGRGAGGAVIARVLQQQSASSSSPGAAKVPESSAVLSNTPGTFQRGETADTESVPVAVEKPGTRSSTESQSQ